MNVPLPILLSIFFLASCEYTHVDQQQATHLSFLRSSTKEYHSLVVPNGGSASGYTEGADETSVAKVGLTVGGVAYGAFSNNSLTAAQSANAAKVNTQLIKNAKPLVTKPSQVVTIPPSPTLLKP